jgi:alpha-L-fucosidase
MRQSEGFTAAAYEPEAWADLFAAAGAKYAVLTTKHHDGFALWPTKFSRWNCVDSSPAGRDLVGPFCDALRKKGLKVGLYFSHLDWSHPDYASVMPTGIDPVNIPESHQNKFAYPQNGENPDAWARFKQFHRAQLKELCETYQPDLLWFDGDWERTCEQWEFESVKAEIKSILPDVVINSRIGNLGDYLTPEQGMPIVPPTGPWEFCVTMNENWGYVKRDTKHKNARQCIRMLCECAGMGGNLLLDIGPKSDGSIIPEQSNVLKQMGAWIAQNGEALFGNRAGLPAGLFYGQSTVSTDKLTLYLIAFDPPVDQIAIKGIRSKIKRISTLTGVELNYQSHGGAAWNKIPGVLWIDIPPEHTHPMGTVVKIEFEDPLDIYMGAGEPISQND